MRLPRDPHPRACTELSPTGSAQSKITTDEYSMLNMRLIPYRTIGYGLCILKRTVEGELEVRGRAARRP